MTGRSIRIGAGIGAIAALAAPLAALAATSGPAQTTPTGATTTPTGSTTTPMGSTTTPTGPTTTTAGPPSATQPAPATHATTGKASAAHHFRIRARDGSSVDGIVSVRFTKANGRLIVHVKVDGLVPGSTHAVTINRGVTVVYRLKSIKANADGLVLSSSTDLTKVANWSGKGLTLHIHRTSSASSEVIASARA